jgi:hypothetical protein
MKNIQLTSKTPQFAYFTFEVDFPFNPNISFGYTDNVYGSWNLQTGEIGIGLGDYRRAEMQLWVSSPEGFEDGNYTEDKSTDRDKITSQDMADILTYSLPSIMSLAVTSL